MEDVDILVGAERAVREDVGEALAGPERMGRAMTRRFENLRVLAVFRAGLCTHKLRTSKKKTRHERGHVVQVNTLKRPYLVPHSLCEGEDTLAHLSLNTLSTLPRLLPIPPSHLHRRQEQ